MSRVKSTDWRRSAIGEGYVETNGVRLWYEELGDPDGETVVLIMGATASVVLG